MSVTEGSEQDQVSRDSQGEGRGFPRGSRAQPRAPEGKIPSRGLRGDRYKNPQVLYLGEECRERGKEEQFFQ